MANGKDIKDEIDFYHLVKPETNIKLFLVTQDEIDIIKSSLPEEIPVMPGTMKMHQLILTKPGAIHYRDVSCYCSSSATIKGQCDCFKKYVYLLEEKAKCVKAGPSSSTKLRYKDVYTSSEDEMSVSSDDEEYEKCVDTVYQVKSVIFKGFKK